MEIALHLRHIDREGDLPEISEHLMSFYERFLATLEMTGWEKEMTGWEKEWEKEWEKAFHSFSRIYVGDEFCLHRLPSPTEMKRFSCFAEERNSGITLLTPVLSDEGIEKCSPLFDCLKERHPEAEVVVNDLGVLFYIKRKYPDFRLSAGRLFNKGFKDPRLSENETSSSISEEADELLSYSTFDHPEFQKKMAEFSVSRLERDLLPYGNGLGNIAASELRTSVYFPFGYVTSGRVCGTASFRQKPEERFAIPVKCARPCNEMTLKLRHKCFSFPMIQNGNTIFYLYTPAMLNALMEKSDHENLRLVYQGFCF